MTKDELEIEIKEHKKEIDDKNRLLIIQSKIAAVGEMINNISHQWRQPLAAITASTAHIQLMNELDKELSQKELQKVISNINSQCQYLSGTINDFKNFFDENSVNSTNFNIQDAIFKTKNLANDSYKNSFIEVVMDLYECNITENENVFIQSLLNLFNNAKDSIIANNIPTGNRYLFITMKKNNKEIQIDFKDSGNGIDEKIIDSIFEPYLTTKHKSRGTGLGLYMTHQIITKHLKGTIEAKNINYEYEGKQLRGAIFKIKLPLD